jgi:aldehyde oxidoreductase
VILTINGISRKIVLKDSNMVLLDVLREELNLTGTKQSCDRKGQCGACTVLVNGKAVRSCSKKVKDLEGASIVTIEGLGTPRNPHLIQEAFVLSGAIQCGYCTPGMIMATKSLLDQNKNPKIPEIKKALARNLCRCTGYKKIIEAVILAGKFIRGETSPEIIRHNLGESMIGVSHPRPSSMLKACGLAKYAADILLHNALEIAVVHSAEHHALIKSINTDSAKVIPGVAGIMTAADITGTNRIRVFVPDQTILCEDKVNYYGDPIAIVAANTREQARAAAAAIKVEYEALPVMKNPEQALSEGSARIHKHSPNLCLSQPQIRGDADEALAESKYVVEATFSTQMVHQASLEPEACVVDYKGEGDKAELTVIGRSIHIHSHLNQIKEAIGWERIKYQEPFVGGQFGIKATISSEAIAAAAALYFKRPVRYIPSLTESMFISSKRHPFYMKVKLGADSSGHLTAYKNEIIIDKGAYYLIAPIIVDRALLMLSNSYYIPNVYALAKMVYTNNTPGGAARGAGPPQVIFALESVMDMLAEKAGIDQLEFRKINSLKPGQNMSNGIAAEQWPFPEVCDAIRPSYERAKREAATFNDPVIKRGVGIACHSFGIAEPGDSSQVSIELEPDDGVTIYGAIADPGEGNDSMLTQIAAHLLGLPMEKVRLYTRDTDRTVNMGPSAGSRMTYMGGGALVNAIEKLKQAMKDSGASNYTELKKAGKPTRYEGTKTVKNNGKLDPKTGQGASFDSQVHNIQMAEVEVNTITGDVRVLKMTTAVDAGPIIHPHNFEGQLEGGMDQGVGYALREEYIPGKTKDWITLGFPTIGTSFSTEIIKRETPRLRGTLGATGIGELTMVSTAPAVVSAIKDACGIRIYDLPATPEKIKAALHTRG